MQRLDSVFRNRKNTPKNQPKEPEDKPEIHQDIHFLINGLFNKTGLNSGKPRSISNDPRYLLLNNIRILSSDFSFNKILRVVAIQNISMVNLSSFNGLFLNQLVFENIAHFQTGILKDFNLISLTFKKLAIGLDILRILISLSSPLELNLISVQRLMTHSSDEFKLHATMAHSRIASLTIENSFIQLDHFLTVISRKNLQKFNYKNLNSIIRFRTLGRYFSYFMVKEIDISRYFTRSWLGVDVLRTDSNSIVLANLSQENSKIKFLWLENSRIPLNLIKRLPRLVSIYLNDCSFEDLGFYELINKQKETLRYISFDDVNVPFDGLEYIYKNTTDCKVFFNTHAVKLL